ncbi:MAG: acetyl-CoA carboxylase biotin carboxyl carrier protein [Candidatus Methylacidiphilales bacterium]
MELKEIKAVIDLMTRNQLAEFELEKDNFKIKIKKAGDHPPVVHYGNAGVASAPVLMSSAPQGSAPAIPTPVVELASINSPMVGTFYRSPSPDSPPFVDIGSRVSPETVVCIVEAMKVMNEIKAETSGVISEVVTENGKPVEFGQPLFKIRAS